MFERKKHKIFVCFSCSAFRPSGVARGASGGTRAGAQALEAHQHTFCSHLKRILCRNLDKNMLKNAYFLEKKHKNCLSVGGSTPEPPLAPRPCVLALAYYYNFVKIISSTKCGLLPSKGNNFCFFQIFAPIFHFELCSFC